jgi:thiamine-monophosphate kinase
MTEREDSFVRGLARHLPPASVGLMGDDCALVDVAGSQVLVSVDALVEDVDFREGLGEPEDLGWKALAAAVSDIAAMGGHPVVAVVGLVLGSHGKAFWDSVYEGLGEAARAFSLDIGGGDLSKGAFASISVTVLGAPGARTVWRSGARPGDQLCVSGPLGAAAAGLQCLQGRRDRSRDLEAAFLRPTPSVSLGMEAARAGATAMIDVSDGLSSDALRIGGASGVGIEIEASLVPLAPGVDDLDLALSGGEDFVLCFTLPDGVLAPSWAIRVGRCILPDSPSRLAHSDGSFSELEATGWNHLAR